MAVTEAHRSADTFILFPQPSQARTGEITNSYLLSYCPPGIYGQLRNRYILKNLIF
jgi:hypothetical protein